MNINKELNTLNQKIVYNLTKFTTTDYTGYLSCVVWLIKCNFRCLYCYNDQLVYAKEGIKTLQDILDFLKTRVGLLEAVVISGGEATSHDLVEFCIEIKKLGFKIKLDTNCTNINLIKKLIDLKLIDFMAIDFKSHKEKFQLITKSNKYDEFINNISYLIKIDFPFELRTTINTELLNEDDINKMIRIIKDLNYKNSYYLQNFLQTHTNIGDISQSRAFDKSKLISLGLDIQWRN